MATVHENQMICGNSIINAFDEEKKHHVLLLSQMQMGKSGTYWYVVLKTLFDTSNGIDDVFIISGNREIELHQQVHDDKHAYRKWFFTQPEILQSFSKEEIKQMKTKSKKHIHIIWGGQLKKEVITNVIPNNSLIVWDEAHYAQSESNAPDKFFKFNNLDTLVNGTVSLEEIQARNIKLLNVSATPFSELVVNKEGNTLHKVVKLLPGHNYYGMEHYSENNLIHPSFIINDDNKILLKEVLIKHDDDNDPKYMIIRLTDYKNTQHIVRSVCEELNISYKIYNSTTKDIEIDDIKQKPDVSTAIIISGMLRMGKVICKDHISMVFEASTMKNTRKIDTGLQGLLGRVCGYSNEPLGFSINIYVEASVIEEITEYLVHYDTEYGPVCPKAMNTRSNAPYKLTRHIYFVKEIPIPTNMMIRENKFHKKTVFSWLKDNTDTMELSDDQIMFLRSEATQFVAKNLTKKSNSGLNKTIKHEFHYSYASMPDNTCYFAYEQDKVWLVLDTIEEFAQPDSDSDSNNEQQYELYVLNKCVFKP
jgi:hypothetical protein